MAFESVAKSDADYILGQVGYACLAEAEGSAYYYDNPCTIPLVLDFSVGSIPWSDFTAAVEAAGTNMDAFNAVIEAMG